MSRALPTAASKIKGIGVPSSLRIEKPAMCRSGFRPTPLGSPGLCIDAMGEPSSCQLDPCLPGHAVIRRSHVDTLELDDQGVVRACE